MPQASLAAQALRRWQHAAGPFWLYVGAAPFLSNLGPGPAGVPHRNDRGHRSGRVSPVLSAALVSVGDAGPRLFVVDLPAIPILRATTTLNERGYAVIPVIHRWLDAPAVLPATSLFNALVAAGLRCRRPQPLRGVILILDGERNGKLGRGPQRLTAFDNRYDYSGDRLPAADLLAAQGIAGVHWVSPSGIAPDLESFARSLSDAGFAISGLTDHDLARLTLDRASWPSDQSAGEESISVKLAAQAPGLYRRFVQRAQLSGLVADHLARSEPYLALSPLVLDAAGDGHLRRLTELFARIFDRAARALAADVPRLEAMGFPWVAAELLQTELPRTPIIGRFDFVRDQADHWWLLEYNADTPSGVREAIAAEAIACDILPAARDLVRPSAGLADALIAAFDAATRDLPPGSALGLLTDAGELEDLAQIVFTGRLIADRLAIRGVAVIVGDIDNLRLWRGGLNLRGRPIQALYRYVPFERWFGTPEFAGLYDAVSRGKIVLLNGLYGLLLQHKGLLAWIWAHRDDPEFSSEERGAIAEHLPPTWDIADVAPGTPGVEQDVVVKQVFGREGEEVFLGPELSAEDWSRLRHRRTYVVQRRIDVAVDDAVIPTSTGAHLAEGHATVGSFAVAGWWAGYYTRFGGRITNAQAKWLATLTWPEPRPDDEIFTGG